MNFPSLNTDSFYKFITLLGLFLIALSCINLANQFKSNRTTQLTSYTDSLKIITEIKNLGLDIDVLSYKIQSNSEISKDSLFTIQIEIKRIRNEIEYKRSLLESVIMNKDDNKYYLIFTIHIFVILLILGLYGVLWGFWAWYSKQQKLKDKEQLRDYIKLGEISERCNSCAKTMSKESLRPKEKNEDFNFIYCSDCYENGEFIEPNLTLKQMKKKIGKKYKNKILLWWRLIQIDKLERWR